jgi:conserved domain protein
MGLTKHKLGRFLELCSNINIGILFGMDDVRGVNNQKQMMPTKADLNGRDLSKFQIVYPGDFVFNHRTSRNGSKFSIAYNDGEQPVICTEDYVVFRVREDCKNALSSRWLYMFFNRPEFDRFVITNSWGSSTEFFNWEDIQSVELTLPDIGIQQKYVDVYNAMLSNQKSYERGLEDLKLVCDAYIEDLRREMTCEDIGPYIESVSESNYDYAYTLVQGVESSGSFMDTRANMHGVDIGKYTVVRNGNIVYNPSRINIGSIAMYTNNVPCVVSPMYSVFKVIDKNKLLPEYLMLWFGREEFHRYTWYYASGSVRDTFDFNLMCEIKIPIPPITIQKNIVNILSVYNTRKEINEKLKAQIKDICPILIKGSIDEGRKTKG